MQRDDLEDVDPDVIHRLRRSAERELEITPQSSPIHDWLADEVASFAEDDDEAEGRDGHDG
jgi:hypothetical protein